MNDSIEQLRKESNQLKDRIAYLEKELVEANNYEETGTSQESYNLLISFFDRMPKPAFIIKDGERLVYFNPAMVSKLGFGADEIKDLKKLFEVFYADAEQREDIRKTFYADLQNTENKREVQRTFRVIQEGGISNVITFSMTKLLFGYAAVVVDVDFESENLPSELLSRNKIYENLFKKSHDGMILLASKRVIDCNQVALEMYGFDTIEEMINIHPLDVAPEYQTEGVTSKARAEEIFKHTEEYGNTTFEWLSYRKDGTTFWSEATVTLIMKEPERISISVFRNIDERKRIEDELRREKELLYIIAENSPIGIIHFTIDGKISFANSKAEEILGLPKKEISELQYDDPVWKVFDFEGTPIQPEELAFTKVLETRKPLLHYKMMLERVDGSKVYMSINTVPLFDDQKSIRGVIASIEDITDSIETSSKLEKQEQQYKLMFDNMISGFALHEIITDDEGKPIDYKVLDINPAYTKLTGIPRERIVGKRITEVLPNLEEELIKVFGKVALTGEATTLEHYTEPLDQYYELYIYSPQKYYFTTMFNNITQIKHTLKALEKSEGKFRAIVENSKDAIWLIDEDAKILEWNKSAEEMTSIKRTEAIGKYIYDIIYQFASEEKKKDNLLITLKKAFERYFDKSDHLHEAVVDGEIHKPDGTILHIQQNFFMVTSNEGKRLGSIVRDITEQHNYKQELLYAKQVAESANKVKSSLLANISHEFRTPMTSILGYSSVLRSILNDPTHAKYVDNINTSGTRLMKTLNDVIELSRMVSMGDITLSDSIRVSDILETLINRFENAILSKGLNFSYSEIQPDFTVRGRIDDIVDCLSRLMDNALKFTDKGYIEIILKSEELDGIPYLKIGISDTGIGVDEAYHEVIFEEFRQVSEGISRNYEGSGLGLTIARQKAKMSDGFIRLESKPKFGSIFWLYLRSTTDSTIGEAISREHRIDNAETSELAKQGKELTKILLVEDNEILYEVVKLYLDGLYDVDIANKGEIAVSKCKTSTYKAILMDINLGVGMNGIETMKEVRKITGYNTVPIIAVTGYALPEEKEKILTERIDDYITKPFEGELLKSVLRKHLGEE